jgi:DNA-binding transcriptional LysR family regulator
MKLTDLRIADLELFITAAQLKNLGQAATFHHLSQSAASTAIQRVELALGLMLCLHERRQFQLTKEGKQFLPKAENWLKSLKEIILSQEEPIQLATTHAIARVVIPTLLPRERIELKLMRPDTAYGSVLRGESDLALVLDNAAWKGVVAKEIGKGEFQLFSSQKDAPEAPVLLPEDQIEVLSFQQRWQQLKAAPLRIKARLPSWSLIADICSSSTEVGFLPDFLAGSLHPVAWQPSASNYRMLALYQKGEGAFQRRIDQLLLCLQDIFRG